MMISLREEGANFNVVDYKARSPLHMSCRKGYIEIVKFLLKQSKYIHTYVLIRCEFGQTR